MASIRGGVGLGKAGQAASEGTLNALSPFIQSTKTGVIAFVTAKEAVRQPLFLVLLVVGILAILLSTFLPYYTFGEDIKMLKDVGLAAILLLSLFLAMVTASNSIAEDIEHRTAITLLSKPINRRQFIVGKFLGIILSVALMFLVLGLLYCAMVYYKVGYDAREAAKQAPTSEERWTEVRQILPGIVLSYFQVVVLSSISVAISTRLPMLVNIVMCLAVYILGQLAPVLIATSKGSFELVEFTAQLLAFILPALSFFNVSSAVATGSEIPWTYVAWNLVYCVLYSGIGILLAFVLFEDRDLA
jgi:ABC-type transport system involved in multi-copper enzyme maturation permease subunit